MASNQGKRTVLRHAIGLLAGRWGEGIAALAGRPAEPEEWPVLPTGFKQLDLALGIGGLPLGRITELLGPDTQGTATLVARIAAKVQRKQQAVTIIDLSRTFRPEHAARCGLGAPELLVVRPDNAFQILSALEQAARLAGLVVIVLARVKETLGHAEPALLKAFLRRLRGIVAHAPAQCAFLFVTTPTESDPFTYANYPAGFPLPEVVDVRIWVQDEKWSQRPGKRSSYRSTLTVIKNRLAPVGKGAEVRVTLARPAA